MKKYITLIHKANLSMKYRVFILIIWLASQVFGQDSVMDSLMKQSKYDEAMSVARIRLNKVKLQSSPSDLGLLYSEIAKIYYKKDNYDSTQYYAKQSLKIGKEYQLPEVITSSYLQLGNIHYSKFEDLKAIHIYQKIDSVSRLKDEKNKHVISALFNLGKVLLRTYSVSDTIYISKAEVYFKRGIEMAIEIEDKNLENYGYVLRGNIFGQRKEYIKAMPYFEKSATYFEEVRAFKDLSGIYWSLGIIYTDLGEINKADEYYHKRINIMNEVGDSNDIANAKRTYAGFLYRIGDYSEAIPYFREAYDYYSNADAGRNGILLGLTTNLAESYHHIKDYKNSSTFYRHAMIYNDSVETRKEKDLALDLEAKYQTEQKVQEIALLAARNKNIETEKANQRNLFLAGFGVFSIAGIFFVLVLRNRQKTNKKLKELDSAKSRFFENISHEFRTPLSLIKGPIEEQLHKENLTIQERKNLTIAKKNSSRLLNLVDQILDLSKLESQHYKLRVQESKISNFLGSLVSSFEYQAETNHQKLIVDITIDQNKYWYDKDVLVKIVNNLLGNAVKYTPNNHVIHVSSFIQKGLLQFEVMNTGVTFTKDEVIHIFSRFHRAHENATGSGIGLALTKELVELHKGNIFAKSKDASVSFVFQIPVEEKAFAKDEKSFDISTMSISDKYSDEKLDLALNKEQYSVYKENPDTPILLIVDDNADIREYLSSLFSESFSIKTAENGKIGFEKAIKYIPDVIITDLMMPDEDGLQLTRNCKTNQATSHIPVLMLTAKAEDENKLVGIETGADAYITKPFNTEIVKATIHNLLESRKKLQERFSQEVILIPKELSINSYDEQFLNNLKEVMDTYLIENDFNAESFASTLNMSRMQLHRKLKALTGLSTTEFIRLQRLKLAVELLKKSDANVSEVGYAVGFNNPSYFAKCFKEEFGISPSDYVKSKS